jgi:hypothetical protein
MFQKMRKLLVLLCVLALTVTALPTVPAKAATAVPKFKTTYASIYENGTSKGKYTYTLQNLKKGQRVDWSVSGAGKAYVTVKKASKKAAKSTMANIITVKTSGKTAAKNKQITLTAKIYSASGKLQSTVTTKAKIKVKPTAVSITSPAAASGTLQAGQSYTFGYQLTPANATSSNVWTVTGADGVDYSSYMSSAGVFKPEKSGAYTIKLSANIGSKTIKSATTTVNVGDYMVSAKQTAGNKIQVNYSGDASELVTANSFTIKSSAGASVLVKDLTFSADGTSAVLTTYSNFVDGTSYTVSDGTTTESFKASVGTPVSMEVLTTQATVNKNTVIEYAIYDENGIDVTEAYPGTIAYEEEISNGILNDDHTLLMKTVGKNATIKLTYTNTANSSLVLKATGVIVCVAAVTSTNTNFTITASDSEPDYTAADYADNRKIAVGSTGYAHFRALDADNSKIDYTSEKYESSDPDTLIVSTAGKLTPIKAGTVKVTVTADYAGENFVYSYDVTVTEAAYLKTIKLSRETVTMSNASETNYLQYINVSAFDQNGDAFPLTGEKATITENGLLKGNLATYVDAENRISLQAQNATAGTYSYTLTLDVDGTKASIGFTVVVVNVSATGTVSYGIDMDRTEDDLALTTDVSASKTVNVRLARYQGGVFNSYNSFTSATITKGNTYYSADLTAGGTTAKQEITGSDVLQLTTLKIASSVCTKAAVGTYTITLRYYSAAAQSYQTLTTYLTLTDSQETPSVRVVRTTASKTCANALALARDCLKVDGATITDCTVTGESQSGAKVPVASGEQVNIKTVTATGTYTIANEQSVTVTYEIAVGKTLTNK